MKWKTTFWLLGLALILFAFICFVEFQTPPPAGPPAHLLRIKPEQITRIQLKRTNEVVLWADKTNQTWNLTLPLFYPAKSFAIESLLQTLAALTSQSYITPQELAANHRTIAEYGLDVPAATLTLHHGGARTEIMFGAKTPVGDHVYAQLHTLPGIYILDAQIFDRLLPASERDWRDPSLLSLVGLSLDRMEVRVPGRGFAVQQNPTNKIFALIKPQAVRANQPRVLALLEKVQVVPVRQFVTDDPRVELEPLGLQPPEAELAFGAGTNDLVVVQFGKSPPSDSSLVYARRMQQTNIVLVPKTVLEAVLTPYAELRDRHLLSFSLTELDTIEVIAREKFTLHLQTNGTWMITEPQVALADPELMHEWLNDLDRLEGAVEKDVVTDFAPYVLTNPPARQYLLKASLTNADGTLTNRLLSELDIGGVGGAARDKIFARRGDENSVYSITPADFDRLPTAMWQLRDRRVWSFTTNQVSRVTVRDRGLTRQWDRSPSGQWRFAAGSQGILDNKQFALEETTFRLGELRASMWVAKGEEERARYGFTNDCYKMTIELKNGDKTNALSLEFGGPAPSTQYHYALATVDGQSWIFEFPMALFFQVIRDFSNPPLRTAASPSP